jgi:hypothetical protein
MMKKLTLSLLLGAMAVSSVHAEILETAAGVQIGKTVKQAVAFHGARPTAQRSGSAQAAVPVLTAAKGTLTFTAQPLNNETVTLGSTTYTFKTTLSTGPAVANEVLRGADVAASIANLIGAINAASSGGQAAGTTYGTGTTANASATAAAGTGSSLVVAASTAGTSGNGVVSTETSSVGSWGGSTLSGGIAAATTAELSTLLNELRAAMVAKGLIKGGP